MYKDLMKTLHEYMWWLHVSDEVGFCFEKGIGMNEWLLVYDGEEREKKKKTLKLWKTGTVEKKRNKVGFRGLGGGGGYCDLEVVNDLAILCLEGRCRMDCFR